MAGGAACAVGVALVGAFDEVASDESGFPLEYDPQAIAARLPGPPPLTVFSTFISRKKERP